MQPATPPGAKFNIGRDIPPTSNRRHQRADDADVCKWRHLIENHFAKTKEFRGMATRYDKTDCSSAANWNLAAVLIPSR